MWVVHKLNLENKCVAKGISNNKKIGANKTVLLANLIEKTHKTFPSRMQAQSQTGWIVKIDCKSSSVCFNSFGGSLG